MAAIDETGFSKATAHCDHALGPFSCRHAVQHPDYRHSWLLRPRRKRPRRCCSGEQSDEVTPPHHSITTSAPARSDGGTVSPSALAVIRLMLNSNLVDCTTGRSAGFAPLRIWPALRPTRRYMSAISVP